MGVSTPSNKSLLPFKEIYQTHPCAVSKLHTLTRTLHRRHSPLRHQHHRAPGPSIPLSSLELHAHNVRLPAGNDWLHIPDALLSE